MGPGMIVDSRMTLEEALERSPTPPDIIKEMCLIDVSYRAFDGMRHQGQLVIHRLLRDEIISLFELMEKIGFPVAKAVPIAAYGWSDSDSMADNNSSAFNYRYVAGTDRLSRHAIGYAVDINPLLNPVVYENGRTVPPGALHEPDRPGTLFDGHPIVNAFVALGWRWGGHFHSTLDYHHFEKHPMDISK